jgi:hypothetical protein
VTNHKQQTTLTTNDNNENNDNLDNKQLFLTPFTKNYPFSFSGVPEIPTFVN